MKRQLLFVIVLSIAISLGAQDFGFGFNNENETTGGISPSVSISGEAAAELLAYVHDFSDGVDQIKLGDIFSGKLNFYAGVSFAEAFINLKLRPIISSPVVLDEAFVRAYIRDFEIEAGLRKLTWGKADSFGPLDVINPLDYSQLTDFSNTMNFKIARPMVHLSYHAGSFSKIEGVFVPTFEPLRFAEEGRWVPAQMAQMAQLNQLQLLGTKINELPDTSTLKYAQAGLRFTTTIGSSDIGIQYYYGRLTRPAVGIILTTTSLPSEINFDYNPYHQFGFDFAQVLYGFNVRAELAANITSDLKGTDGAVYNPHVSWSLGFDRDLVYGINLNIQCNESIRLMNNKINNDKLLGMIPLDIEAGAKMISTQIIAALSKTFFKGQLEARAAVFYELEAKDFMLIPSLVWTKDALSFELSAGIFGGDESGQFGQYWKNSFIKTVLKYSF